MLPPTGATQRWRLVCTASYRSDNRRLVGLMTLAGRISPRNSTSSSLMYNMELSLSRHATLTQYPAHQHRVRTSDRIFPMILFLVHVFPYTVKDGQHSTLFVIWVLCWATFAAILGHRCPVVCRTRHLPAAVSNTV